MIVLIQMLIEKYHDRIEQWEKDRDEWASENEYRYPYEYERHVAHPRKKLMTAVRLTLTVVAIAFLIFFATLMAIATQQKEDKRYAEISYGKNCKAHNMGDRVKINYGTYAEKIGTIVGGCEKDVNYRVKFEAGQSMDYPSDGQETIALREDTIDVDSYRNLTKIEDKK